MLKRIALGLLLPALLAASVWAADIKLEGVKCLVAGSKAASSEQSAAHKGGKVFFCCGNCKKAFETAPAKFTVKANHQLVVTGQAKQSKCPLSGIACKEDKFVDVAGAKVHFCCDNCKAKVADAKGDEQAALVFSDAAFEKAGFKVGK
jgi:YHS domain-containing protein